MKVIGILVTAIAVAALNAILNGWAFVTLWNWFVLPSFESAPVLSIPVAIGIGILISLGIPIILSAIMFVLWCRRK